ncbi:hypothetical protein QJQ45_007443 [Haematococcus lacustris]|nr:hypothetical protein QJQ45_000222 [Haematococcus lacustris]KAJ9520581.1 hypothetical protein QJQ45_007442 [Haematococcus lacustris]KAJ9520583.1 hypothetical protein QJQ45_007443 [Haematococcus lacustris]
MPSTPGDQRRRASCLHGRPGSGRNAQHRAFTLSAPAWQNAWSNTLVAANVVAASPVKPCTEQQTLSHTEHTCSSVSICHIPVRSSHRREARTCRPGSGRVTQLRSYRLAVAFPVQEPQLAQEPELGQQSPGQSTLQPSSDSQLSLAQPEHQPPTTAEAEPDQDGALSMEPTIPTQSDNTQHAAVQELCLLQEHATSTPLPMLQSAGACPSPLTAPSHPQHVLSEHDTMGDVSHSPAAELQQQPTQLATSSTVALPLVTPCQSAQRRSSRILSTPMEGIPERMSSRSLRHTAQRAPQQTATPLSGSFYWMTPTEGVLERQLLVTAKRARTPHSTAAIATPVEGVPEKGMAYLPMTVAAQRRQTPTPQPAVQLELRLPEVTPAPSPDPQTKLTFLHSSRRCREVEIQTGLSLQARLLLLSAAASLPKTPAQPSNPGPIPYADEGCSPSQQGSLPARLPCSVGAVQSVSAKASRHSLAPAARLSPAQPHQPSPHIDMQHSAQVVVEPSLSVPGQHGSDSYINDSFSPATHPATIDSEAGQSLASGQADMCPGDAQCMEDAGDEDMAAPLRGKGVASARYGDDENDEVEEGGHLLEHRLATKGARPDKSRKSMCPPAHREATQFRSRRSLTGAGLLLDDSDGMRRSSRSRIRPLEYWRNEHKLYGRQHKTLPTVVGIETRTPNPDWPMLSTGHVCKKSKARTKRGSKH